MWEVLAVEDIGKSVDEARVEKHARLRARHGEAVEDGVELEGGEFRLGSVDARDAEAVLRGERGDDAHAEGAHGGHGLEVGLDACAAAGVGAGNGEDVGGLYHGSFLIV